MAKKIILFILKWAVIFFVVSVIAFLIPRLIPEDPVESLLESFQMVPTEENVRRISAAWGLDKPLYEQYWIWIKGFLRGDWGKSLITKQDIREEFVKKLPYSMAIGFGGLILAAPLSFLLGYGAAVKNSGICDRITRVLSLMAVSVPTFVLSVIIVYFFGVRFGLVNFFTGNGRWSLIFAILIMAFYTLGPTARIVKAQFREQMTRPYMTFAVARGFPKYRILLRHGFKPVLYGMLSVTISRFAYILGGSSVLEFSFGIPGISYFLVNSMHKSDFFVLQSYLMVVGIWMFVTHLVFNFILDLLDARSQA